MVHTNIDAATAQGLKVLIERIQASGVPPSKLDETILVASWNICEFGKSKRSPRGRPLHCRSPELV